MINILLVVFIFLFVILWHEFGHFSIAKMVGVKVNEFSIGMGPRIFYKKRRNTEYSFRAIPVGGFVSMEGEEENSSDPRAFQNSSIIKRMAIVVAGATMNFILGFLVLLLLYILVGQLQQHVDLNLATNNTMKSTDDRIHFVGDEADKKQPPLHGYF